MISLHMGSLAVSDSWQQSAVNEATVEYLV